MKITEKQLRNIINESVRTILSEMYDNYNYPAGADDSSAPWNQSEPKETDSDGWDFKITGVCTDCLKRFIQYEFPQFEKYTDNIISELLKNGMIDDITVGVWREKFITGCNQDEDGFADYDYEYGDVDWEISGEDEKKMYDAINATKKDKPELAKILDAFVDAFNKECKDCFENIDFYHDDIEGNPFVPFFYDYR